MGLRLRHFAAVSCASALLPLIAAAGADPVHEIRAGADHVVGTLAGAADVDRVPILLLDGAQFEFTVTAPPWSGLHPDVKVLGPDGQPDAAANAALKAARTGRSVALRRWKVEGTGRRYLEIRGADGTGGAWELSTKVRLPRGTKAVLGAGDGTVDFPITVPGRTVAQVEARSARRGGAAPTFVSLRDPQGNPASAGEVLATPTGFDAPAIPLSRFGTYLLCVRSEDASDVVIRARWTVTPEEPREFADSDIVVEPLITSCSYPDLVNDVDEPVTVDLGARFVAHDASVLLRSGGATVTIPAYMVSPREDGFSFLVYPSSLAGGSYAVEVRNPDGGAATAPAALLVRNGVARPAAMTPAAGVNNEAVQVTVTGKSLFPDAAVSLRRGYESIPATGLARSMGTLTAGFDLRGRTPGTWDLVIANRGAPAGRLTGAFELLNAPPVVTLVDAGDYLATETEEVVITGREFDRTPSVVLRAEGRADLPATAVSLAGSTEIRATFETAETPSGKWDLVVANPDGQQTVVPGAVRTGGGRVRTSANQEFHGPLATAYSATQNRFVVTGLVGLGGSRGVYTGWGVFAMALSPLGEPVGTPVQISAGSSDGFGKRDVTVAWDSVHDRYLVSWSEDAGNDDIWCVQNRLLDASDLRTIGSQVVLQSQGGQHRIGSFSTDHPSTVYDPLRDRWLVAWRAFESTGNNDIAYTYLHSSTLASLASTVRATTDTSDEGDPLCVWDPIGKRTLVYFIRRASTSSPFGLYVFANGLTSSPSAVTSDSGSTIVDPRAAIDPVTGRLLLTWTASDRTTPVEGTRSIRAALVDLSAPATVVGSVATIAGAAGESHFEARPAFEPSSGRFVAAWTRIDADGRGSAHLRWITAGSGGLSTTGSEVEVSGGGKLEAAPTLVGSPQKGEVVAFWLNETFEVAVDERIVPNLASASVIAGEQVWLQRVE